MKNSGLLLPGERADRSNMRIAFWSLVAGMLFAWIISSAGLGIPEAQAQTVRASDPMYMVLKEISGSLKKIAGSLKTIEGKIGK